MSFAQGYYNCMNCKNIHRPSKNHMGREDDRCEGCSSYSGGRTIYRNFDSIYPEEHFRRGGSHFSTSQTSWDAYDAACRARSNKV